MKIRDQLANDITSAVQTYIQRYSKFEDIPEDRKRDIQQIWLILNEKSPVKLRKQLQKKVDEMPSGIWLLFMFDLKKLKTPLIGVLSHEKYQKPNLKYCYEKELSINGHQFNRDDIFLLVERVSQLETKVTKYESRTQNLELEVSRLTRENTFLSQKILELYEKNKQLENDKKVILKRAENAESKLQSIEDKYKRLLDENTKLKEQLKSLKKNVSCHQESVEMPTISLGSYS